MASRSILAVFILLIASDCIAADAGRMGGPLPDGPAAAAQRRVAMPDWSSVALDGLSGKVISRTLSRAAVDVGAINTRGRKEIEIYRKTSPAVVLVATTDGYGSGSYLGSGQILTNWHVVRSFNSVGVLFKSESETSNVDIRGIIRAEVLRSDPVRDLALLRVAIIPKGVHPLELGSEIEVEIGADVHAIGHPTGEAWTYTKGLISQVRKNYEWNAGGRLHRATVIQTQTPINPGNSGGPLIGDSGKLLGVNSFKSTAGEGLNFAISVTDVLAFLGSAGIAEKPLASGCTPLRLYDGRTRTNDGRLLRIDTDCDDKADTSVLTPDDRSKAIMMLIDSNSDGKVDLVVEDRDRDGRWDISFHDVDHDGAIDLVGYHPDGNLKPSRFEKYTARQ